MASPLGKLFGRSPIAPIQQHMQLAEESVQLLCELLTASADENRERVDEIDGLIEESATKAREMRREIREHLPRGLLLAIPRPSLLELLNVQHQVSETVRDIARPVALRAMTFPPSLHKPLDRYCSLIAAASSQALEAIRELDELIEQGFGQQERKHVEKLFNRLDRHTQRCAAQHDRLFRQLCKVETELPPLDAMFHFRIAAALERLSGHCCEVGEQLRLLLAR